MKQHITKEQWNELASEQMRGFLEGRADMIALGTYPNIGQMIEFLGDDIAKIAKASFGKDGWLIDVLSDKGFFHTELVDALWEAVKEKLI